MIMIIITDIEIYATVCLAGVVGNVGTNVTVGNVNSSDDSSDDSLDDSSDDSSDDEESDWDFGHGLKQAFRVVNAAPDKKTD